MSGWLTAALVQRPNGPTAQRPNGDSLHTGGYSFKHFLVSDEKWNESVGDSQ
jgi:hypothetical protein